MQAWNSKAILYTSTILTDSSHIHTCPVILNTCSYTSATFILTLRYPSIYTKQKPAPATTYNRGGFESIGSWVLLHLAVLHVFI
ncbi:hypothetical protein [Pontibacter mucosus]|uniref:hypothetical protein n=1 Tax=Pontibacter mucosus TaxID=1649266 RepID=UPI0011B29A3A|nr:hypothetical protein [Pontibacter mucosus]